MDANIPYSMVQTVEINHDVLVVRLPQFPNNSNAFNVTQNIHTTRKKNESTQ